MRCTGPAVVALVAALASPGLAATITHSGPPGAILFYSHGGGASASGSQAFPSGFLFDPALGTLHSVELSGISTASVTKTLDVQPGEYSVLGQLEVLLEEVGGPFSILALQPFGFHTETVNSAGPHAFSEGNSFLLTLSSSQNLDFFIQGGSLQGTSTGMIAVSDSGGSVYDGIADALGGETRLDSVTYTYTPVPEPGAATLTALGLAGLALRRRLG